MGFPQVVEIDAKDIPAPPLLEQREVEKPEKPKRARHSTPPPVMRPKGMPRRKLDGSSMRRGPSASSLPTEPARPLTVVRPQRRQPSGGFLASFWKCKYLKRWFKSLLGWACIIVVLANGASGQFLEQLTKVAGSIARVTESMSLAAASAIDHGTGLAASTSSAVLAFSTGAVGLAQTAWQGVDLLDLHCVKTTGTITAAHNQALIDWLRGPFSAARHCHPESVGSLGAIGASSASSVANCADRFGRPWQILAGASSLCHSSCWFFASGL